MVDKSIVDISSQNLRYPMWYSANNIDTPWPILPILLISYDISTIAKKNKTDIGDFSRFTSFENSYIREQ